MHQHEEQKNADKSPLILFIMPQMDVQSVLNSRVWMNQIAPTNSILIWHSTQRHANRAPLFQ